MSLAKHLAELERGRNLALSDAQRSGLSSWLEAAKLWNEKLDLTAATDDRALVEVLAFDALVLAAEGKIEAGTRILDVGTGAGTPGLGLGILRPDLGRIVLVEPLKKRAAFLRTVIGSLRIEDRISVVSAKIDPDRPPSPVDLAAWFGGSPVDLAISRATFPPPVWARVGPSLAKEALLMLVDELPPLPEGSVVIHDVRYRVPSSGAPRRFVRIARGSTPSAAP